MEETEAQNPDNGVPTDESRVQAALAALSPEEEVVAAEEVATDPETPEPTEGDDQPLTPGEDNIEAESSGLASLARRERRSREQAKDREEKFTTREKELDERLRRAEMLEGQLDGLKAGLRDDPVGTLRELGIEDGYADVASALYDQELGEDSPDDWKEKRATRAMSARIRKLEDERKTFEETRTKEKQQSEFQSFQRNYLNEMDGYMREVPKGLTYASALYGSKPTEAVEAMYGIAYQTAQDDPNASLPSPESLAEALNHNLQETLGPIIDAILALKEEATIPSDEPPVRTAPKTLRNAQSPRTTKRPPAATEEDRFKRALAALEANNL